MKIRPCFLSPPPAFAEARAASRNFVDEREFPERISSIDLGVSGPIKRWRTDFLFDYQRWCTRRALALVRQRFFASNPEASQAIRNTAPP